MNVDRKEQFLYFVDFRATWSEVKSYEDMICNINGNLNVVHVFCDRLITCLFRLIMHLSAIMRINNVNTIRNEH
jgi:hypothetical protein